MGEATILNKGNGCGEWTAGRKRWNPGGSAPRLKTNSRDLVPAIADRYCTVNCTVLLRDAVPDVAFTVIV